MSLFLNLPRSSKATTWEEGEERGGVVVYDYMKSFFCRDKTKIYVMHGRNVCNVNDTEKEQRKT